MKGFTPIKKRANAFKYTPRYYDPVKEAMEQRRAELRGERSDAPAGEYQPGDYIRTQAEARRERRASRGSGMSKLWVTIGTLALVLVFIMVLAPRLVMLFTSVANNDVKQQKEQVEEFDPYAPLLVVPNDYEFEN